MKNKVFAQLFCFCLLPSSFCLSAFAQSTAFTYQGRLNDGGGPANGIYDLRFTIYDSTNNPGVLIAGPLTNSAVAVSNGLFTTAMDFGASPFTGADLWLEIGVRSNALGSFATLAPRQPLTPTPYAINAANLMSLAGTPLDIKVAGRRALRLEPTIDAPNLIGGAQGNFIAPGTYGSVIGGGGFGGNTNKVETFSGTISGGAGNTVRGAGGFIGGGFYNTIGLDAFDAVVTGGQANQIGDIAYQSVIGGGLQNLISNGVRYATIGGGVVNIAGANEATVSGGAFNNAIGFSSTVGGGGANSTFGAWTVIGGGRDNIISNVDYATIGGGRQNTVRTNARYATISGGGFNTAGAVGAVIAGGGVTSLFQGPNQTFSDASAIGGGFQNTIGTNSSFSAIVGGNANMIRTNAIAASIGGGSQNQIDGAPNAHIGGGLFNVIRPTIHSVIAGGAENLIQTNSSYTAIGGGFRNTIQTNASYSLIAGGWGNTVGSNGQFAVIGGGQFNSNAAIGAVIGGGGGNIIERLANESVIAGGIQNRIDGSQAVAISGGSANTNSFNSPNGVIGGGMFNLIADNSPYATIAGGWSNRIGSGADYATIPGGRGNRADRSYTLAAGRRAGALHQGAWVWADSQDADFNSTANDQFNVRAGGGLRLVTGGAGVTVDGQTVVSGPVGSGQIADGSITAADVNAASFSNTFWKVNGNAGTTPGLHFLGTTDNRALEFNVNGARAFRLEPNPTGGPNVIAGNAGNFIQTNSADSAIGGGQVNEIQSGSSDSVIGGGGHNSVLTNAPFSTIAGGYQNTVQGGAYSALAGGYGNVIGDSQSFIGGGLLNTNNGGQSVIGGGGGNTIETHPNAFSVIGGGSGNKTRTNATRATIGGGELNVVGSASWATIAGGYHNTNNGNYSIISGGVSNTVTAARATVSGGVQNLAGGDTAAVGGGQKNAAQNFYATVGGGRNNVASGISSTVPGGENNTAGGGLSFAAGQNARALHLGSFVWADSFGSDFTTSFDNQFLIRAQGGVGIGTTNPIHQLTVGVPETPLNTPSIAGLYRGGGSYLTLRDTTTHVEALVGADATAIVAAMTDHAVSFRAGNGAGSGNVEYMRIARGGNVGIGVANPTNRLHVAGGVSATAFVNTSDRNAKENFQPVSPAEVLAKVAALPISTWNFKELRDGRHMGPMAQDFYAAFGLGGSDTTITSVDPDGVALAAIQGLNEKLTAELKQKDSEITELKQRLAALEEFVLRRTSN